MAKGYWEETEEFLYSRKDRWLVNQMLTDAAAAVPTYVFENWARSRPSPIALSLLGAAQIRDAWEIRGRDTAENVHPKAWEGFFAGLEQAEHTLRQAVTLDPSSPEPWVPLLISARGLSLGKEEIDNRFAQLQSLEGFRPDGCSAMLQALSEKWAGTHQDMFEFARWIERKAPPASPARAALPMAHIEFVLFDDYDEQRAYFAMPTVTRELVESCGQFLESTPVKAEPAHLEVLNLFLFTLDPTKGPAAHVVQECIERIADRPTVTPWEYFDDDIGQYYAEFRDYGRLAARRFVAQ